jgi:hypothetical protein
MGTVLLIGYGLIRWSGREDEQANEGSSGSTGVVATGKLGLRSPAKHNAQADTSNYSTNQGYNGGEA